MGDKWENLWEIKELDKWDKWDKWRTNGRTNGEKMPFGMNLVNRDKWESVYL